MKCNLAGSRCTTVTRRLTSTIFLWPNRVTIGRPLSMYSTAAKTAVLLSYQSPPTNEDTLFLCGHCAHLGFNLVCHKATIEQRPQPGVSRLSVCPGCVDSVRLVLDPPATPEIQLPPTSLVNAPRNNRVLD